MYKYILAVILLSVSSHANALSTLPEEPCSFECTTIETVVPIWHEETYTRTVTSKVEHTVEIKFAEYFYKKAKNKSARKGCAPPDVYDEYFTAVSSNENSWEGFTIVGTQMYDPNGNEMYRCGGIRKGGSNKRIDYVSIGSYTYTYFTMFSFLEEFTRKWVEYIPYTETICIINCCNPKYPESPAVPEPGTLLLFGTGLALSSVVLRKRHK